MKFAAWLFFVALLIAFASAGVIPQKEEQYLPPVAGEEQPVEDAAPLADDGYRYKTVRKLRHRRDVSELAESAVLSDDGYHYRAPEAEEPLLKVSNEYLPPNEEATDVKEVTEAPQVVSEEYLPPVEEVAEIKEAPVVTEAPIVLDVPQPSEVSNEYLPPADDSTIVEGPTESGVLADDGYHYRRIRYRRDVSEIVVPAKGYLYEAPAVAKEVYLPPAEVKEAVPEPSEAPQVENEYLPPVAEVKESPEVVEAPVESAELADDGYRYKTVRRLKHRQRRDVSEIVASSSGYLYEAPAAPAKAANVFFPPAEVKEAIPEPSKAPQVDNVYLPPAKVKEAVPEPLEAPQVGNVYLPPAEVKEAVPEPTEAPQVDNVYLSPAEVKEAVPESSEVPQVDNVYLPPAEVKETVPEPSEAPQVDNVYLPPAEVKEAVPEPSEAPQVKNVYLPPAEIKEAVPEPSEAPQVKNVYLPPAEVKEAVPEPSEAPQVENKYLPPVAEVKEAPEVVEAPVELAELADDGYRYKTVRRLKYRQRRDVSEIVAPASGYLYEAPAAPAKAANVYLPPAEVKEAVPGPSEAPHVDNVYLTPAEVKEAVPEPNEAPQVDNEYLPPVAEVKEAPKAVEAPAETANAYLPPVAEVKEASETPVDTTVLAEDGYRYKTIRRLKYRHRRDVSEIIAPESAALADDGYHYKVPEESAIVPNVSNEYLPPAELKETPEATYEVPVATQALIVTEAPVATEAAIVTEAPLVTESAVVTEAKIITEAPVIVTESPVIVTEAPVITEASKISNEYLPPSEDVPELKEASELPETSILADDGYHYKANEGFRFRRDVSEVVAPSNGYLYEAPALPDDSANLYLPPVEAKEAEVPQASNEYLPPVEKSKDDSEVVEAPQESADLADDGYHYKTVRRLKYRQRRDVSEIAAPNNAPNGYFYPSPVKQAVDIPAEDSAVLADDGYHYRTIRRIRYRHRRDVSEIANAASDGYVYEAPTTTKPIANEYIPPVEQVPEVNTVEDEPSEAAPEVAKEYLPPAEETRGDSEIVEAPEDSAVLADDGYRYKTVRRIRYRRDVSEIVNNSANGYVYEAPAASAPVTNEYLPPVEQVPEVKAIEAEPTEAAPEVANEYLPPAEETRGEAEIVEAPEESAVLADDGYRYKTIRRIR